MHAFCFAQISAASQSQTVEMHAHMVTKWLCYTVYTTEPQFNTVNCT